MNEDGYRSSVLQGPGLGPVIPNIATMLERNAMRWPNHAVFREWYDGNWEEVTWEPFIQTLRTIASRLHAYGFEAGDRMAIVSQNRFEMLAMELAVMASGGIAVPIFPHYPASTLNHFLAFCGAKFISVAGSAQLQRMTPHQYADRIFVFDNIQDARFPHLIPFEALLKRKAQQRWMDVPRLSINTDPDTICLMQYTSGTTARRKLVQLTHRNILSQQAALDQVWDLNETDRLLSYLPWHHSFGGIFELFSSLNRGATMTLEPSYGKDPASILRTWQEVQPTAFFSVPRVYQALVDSTRGNEEAQSTFFHNDLKFVFTAAAPLADHIAREFDARGIRIIEGWGLTETSPCCTITGTSTQRKAGIVGYPIPGVSIRIGDGGEIQVHGPNVMKGYYDNDEANAEAFTADGWYRTGDIGAITADGLQLIGRNDRIFKLSNGEKIISADVERALQSACPFLTFAVIEGSGQSHPVALLFPNRGLLGGSHAQSATAKQECVCPESAEDLAKCLAHCLTEANEGINPKFARVPVAILIDEELSIETNTLTPSMKVIAPNVVSRYREAIDQAYQNERPDAGENSGSQYFVELKTNGSPEKA